METSAYPTVYGDGAREKTMGRGGRGRIQGYVKVVGGGR